MKNAADFESSVKKEGDTFMKDRQTLNYRGELLNVRMQQTGTIAEPASLNRMAKEALNYLENNPNPALNYECRFAIYPSHIPYHTPFFPPNEYGYDTISLGDTDLRMQLIWESMRQMAGIAGSSETERGVNRRSASYTKEDGCSYMNPAAHTGVAVDGVWMSVWSTSHQLLYLCDQYEIKVVVCMGLTQGDLCPKGEDQFDLICDPNSESRKSMDGYIRTFVERYKDRKCREYYTNCYRRASY